MKKKKKKKKKKNSFCFQRSNIPRRLISSGFSDTQWAIMESIFSDDEKKICRICLEYECETDVKLFHGCKKNYLLDLVAFKGSTKSRTPGNINRNGNKLHLISPCACSGSVKYVHVKCLSHWLKIKYPLIASERPTSKPFFPIVSIGNQLATVFRDVASFFSASVEAEASFDAGIDSDIDIDVDRDSDRGGERGEEIQTLENSNQVLSLSSRLRLENDYDFTSGTRTSSSRSVQQPRQVSRRYSDSERYKCEICGDSYSLFVSQISWSTFFLRIIRDFYTILKTNSISEQFCSLAAHMKQCSAGYVIALVHIVYVSLWFMRVRSSVQALPQLSRVLSILKKKIATQTFSSKQLFSLLVKFFRYALFIFAAKQYSAILKRDSCRFFKWLATVRAQYANIIFL